MFINNNSERDLIVNLWQFSLFVRDRVNIYRTVVNNIEIGPLLILSQPLFNTSFHDNSLPEASISVYIHHLISQNIAKYKTIKLSLKKTVKAFATLDPQD
jgi:hypothetical protein